MDPEFVLSSVHLSDPDDPLPPELQPGGISPDQILTPRRRSAASTATASPPAQAVNSARARSRAPAGEQQNTSRAALVPVPQAGSPACHPAAEQGHSQRSGGRMSGSLASAAAPTGRPPRKPRRVAVSAKRSPASRSEPGPEQVPQEPETAGGQGTGAEQAQQPEGGQGAEGAGVRTQLEREQEWFSMWDNEQLDGLLYSDPLASEALADVRPEDLPEGDLVALGLELQRQQMHAQGRATAVQEASLEDLIDHNAYKEVGPLPLCLPASVLGHALDAGGDSISHAKQLHARCTGVHHLCSSCQPLLTHTLSWGVCDKHTGVGLLQSRFLNDCVESQPLSSTVLITEC